MSTPMIDRKRFMAAIALRDETVCTVADKVRCTQQHLRYALRGERRLSRHLLAALRGYFGDATWSYVTGQSDLLPGPIFDARTTAT
jgi:hypothetical protein